MSDYGGALQKPFPVCREEIGPHTRQSLPARRKENTKPPGFLLLSHHPCRSHRPFVLFLVTIPILLHWRRCPSHVGGPHEVDHRTAAPLIRQEVTHSPLPLPPSRLLLDSCPQLGLLILPPRAVLEEVVSRLLRSTVVLRVAPPAVVVRPVVHALQVHTREGMPGLELVEPRGCPFLRLSWGRVRLPFLPKDVTFVETSSLAPGPCFRPLLL